MITIFDKWEAVIRRCSIKKVFLGILQNSQKNICVRVSFLINFQAWYLFWRTSLLKKRLWHRCFPVNFAKFLRTAFFCRTSPVAAYVFLSVYADNSVYIFKIWIWSKIFAKIVTAFSCYVFVTSDMFDRVLNMPLISSKISEFSLRKKCLNLVFLWSVFSRNRTEYGDLLTIYFQ